MNPQWNIFQPPVSEPSLLDYNRPYNTIQSPAYSSNQTSNLYNGLYNPSNSHFSNPKPMPSVASHNPYPSSSSYFNSSASSQHSAYSNVPVRTPDISSQSNYYSSNNSGSNSSYEPPISNFKIGTFTLNANGYASESNCFDSPSSGGTNYQNNSYQSSSSTSAANQDLRETGIIEKLLQTYGFIQCCERQARLFFHFSQFDGNTEHLRIGDPVEFEVTFDKRTGKPIASTVSKISPEVVLSEERVVGIVTTELKSEYSGEHQGRISYENKGECFFLPYVKEDVEGYVTLKPGDKVSFQIATNQRSGNLGAKHVRLENPVEPVKYQGVVSAIKDSFGFVERADVVDEIFFHFSESKDIPGGLKLGDDVEFLIQSHNGKEVASNMKKLPPGTVVFEDINPEEIRGQVLKPVEKGNGQTQKDPLTGRIRYRGKDRSEVEVKFGERDQKGDFTLKHGDWVKFNIATDRRDNLQKATHISLLDESFNVSGEKREQGIISSLKDGFGFIQCADRDAQMFFSYSELLDPQREICINEEVEFTVITDQTSQSPNRLCAIRIRRLATGTVKFEVLIQENVQGEITFEPRMNHGATTLLENGDSQHQPGVISYLVDGMKQYINFYPEEQKKPLQLGDRINFNIYMVKNTKKHIAMNIVPLPAITSINPSSVSAGRQSLVGSGRTFDRGSSNISTVLNQHISTELSTGFTHTAPPMSNNSVMFDKPNYLQEPAVAPNVSFEPYIKSTTETNHQIGNGIFEPNQSSNPEPAVPEPSNPDPDLDFEDLKPNFEEPPSSNAGAARTSTSSYKTSNGTTSHSSNGGSRQVPFHHGYIATLKESFGFIETQNRDREIFFHFSNYDGNVNDLDLGDEVEYTISNRTGPGGKLSAEKVRVLPLGSLATPKILGQVYEGAVLRPMRSVNPDQMEYCGLVCVGKEEEKLGKHQFGIVGLVNKKELLQPSDQVTFQLDEDGWAVNIRSVRKKLLATVETVKGQYGFLNISSEEGKRLFFHQSEVKDGITLSPGDEVEFVIITNLKTGKSSACNITRMHSNTGRSQRPDRLVSKLKNLTMDTNKKRMQVVRQPKGPDGTKGFKTPRNDLIGF